MTSKEPVSVRNVLDQLEPQSARSIILFFSAGGGGGRCRCDTIMSTPPPHKRSPKLYKSFHFSYRAIGNLAVGIYIKAPVLFSQIFSQLLLSAEGLRKKDSRNSRLHIHFQLQVAGPARLHATGPTVHMGAVWEMLKNAQVMRRHAPEAQCRFALGIRFLAARVTGIHYLHDLFFQGKSGSSNV